MIPKWKRLRLPSQNASRILNLKPSFLWTSYVKTTWLFCPKLFKHLKGISNYQDTEEKPREENSHWRISFYTPSSKFFMDLSGLSHGSSENLITMFGGLWIGLELRWRIKFFVSFVLEDIWYGCAIACDALWSANLWV